MKIIETDQMSESSQRTLNGLRRAVANALERKRRLGHYRVVRRDGRLREIDPALEEQSTLLRSRAVEQEVLNMLDEPAPR